MKEPKKNRKIFKKMTKAVISSSALSTILLLVLPSINLLAFLVIINIFGMVARNYVENNLSLIFVLIYISSVILILLSGLVLNFVIMRKATFANKIVSIILYIIAMTIIGVLLFPYINSQVLHQSLKV